MDLFVRCFFCVLVFFGNFVKSQDLHPIEPKPGLCFKIHTPDQPIYQPNPRKALYSDLHEACTEWLQENKNCLGLKTQNNEVIILNCKGVQKPNRPGCYKMINRNRREEIVCQKMVKQQGCEVITTRTNLNIVAYCNNRALSVVDVKKQKPKRE